MQEQAVVEEQEKPAPDATEELNPSEVKTAVEALPKGHICVLTPRVKALEERLAALETKSQQHWG